MAELAAILARRREVNAAKGEVILSGQGSGPIASSSPCRKNNVAVGDEVEARFRGGTEWLPGVVSHVNDDGSLAVAYAGGERESGLSASLVRRRALATGPHSEGDAGAGAKCTSFKIDTSAAAFGHCVCGRPKRDHQTNALPGPRGKLAPGMAARTEAQVLLASDGPVSPARSLTAASPAVPPLEQIDTARTNEVMARLLALLPPPRAAKPPPPPASGTPASGTPAGMAPEQRSSGGGGVPPPTPATAAAAATWVEPGAAVWYSHATLAWAEGTVIAVEPLNQAGEAIRVAIQPRDGERVQPPTPQMSSLR